MAVSESLQEQELVDVLKTAVNKIFAKLKEKNLIRIKNYNISMIFDSIPKSFIRAAFITKYE